MVCRKCQRGGPQEDAIMPASDVGTRECFRFLVFIMRVPIVE